MFARTSVLVVGISYAVFCLKKKTGLAHALEPQLAHMGGALLTPLTASLRRRVAHGGEVAFRVVVGVDPEVRLHGREVAVHVGADALYRPLNLLRRIRLETQASAWPLF